MSRFKEGDVEGLLDYLDEMAVSNDMMREHLLCLDLSGKYEKKMNAIDPKTKSAFTRAYNKLKSGVKRIGKARKDENPSPSGDQSDDEKDEWSDHDDGGLAMLDEDEIKEVKAARLADKERRK